MRSIARNAGVAMLVVALAGCAANPQRVKSAATNLDVQHEVTRQLAVARQAEAAAASLKQAGDTREIDAIIKDLIRLNAGMSVPGYQPVRVTPLSAIDGIAPSLGEVTIPADTYTRLHIVAQDGSANSGGVGKGSSPGTQEVYPYRQRSAIERFFVGKRHSETLAIKVDSGDFTATVPLLTLSHDSTRGEGEVFSRSIYHVAQKFPLFLVRGTGVGDVARVTITASGSDKTESSAAATALAAVMAATGQIVSPPALLTKLSSESNKAVATSIDTAISSLFATKLSEEQVIDGPVGQWKPVTVDLRLPYHEGKWNRLKADRDPLKANIALDDLDYMQVGRWKIGFDKPRISAFSKVEVICPASGACDSAKATARKDAEADIQTHLGDILHFPVIVNGDQPVTLGAYLRQHKEWSSLVQALAKGKISEAAMFCRKVRSTLSEIGFNTFDGYMAILALRQSDDLTKEQSAQLTVQTDCAIS